MLTNVCLSKLIIYLSTSNRFKAKIYTSFLILFEGPSYSIPTNSTTSRAVVSSLISAETDTADSVPWNKSRCPTSSVEPPHPAAAPCSFSSSPSGHMASAPERLKIWYEPSALALAKEQGLGSCSMFNPLSLSSKPNREETVSLPVCQAPHALLLAPLNEFVEKFCRFHPEHKFSREEFRVP